MLLRNLFTNKIIFEHIVTGKKFYFRNFTTALEKSNIQHFRKMEGHMKIRANPVVTKLDTPEFKSIFTDEVKSLVKLFEKYNYELRVAGGAVRDILMNMHPKDIDFATTATPDEMKDMFTKENIRMINMKGEKHGTITPRINDKENFEVTTLRIDVLTNGRHAEVQFTTDWQLDANRRDLTINSMFLGFDGSIYDYFYGYEDLKNRRVVFVGNPEIRIKEDFLRILRYFRFYGRIATEPDNHDEQTIKAISSNVEGLKKISGERIWSELKKTLQGKYVLELVTKMLKCGMAEYIGLPKNSQIQELEVVLNHSYESDEKFYPITFMSALLTNVEDAAKMHERLKLSAFERDLALFITQNREQFRDSDDIMIYKKFLLQPYARKEFIEELLKYLGKLELVKEFKSWKMPRFEINGLIIKEKISCDAKSIGEIMTQLKLIWAEENFQTSVDDLLNLHLPRIYKDLQAKGYTPKRFKSNKS